MAVRHALARPALFTGSLAVSVFALAYFAGVSRNLKFDIGDEGYVLYVAKQLTHGKRLYADLELFSYLPGTFYLFAPIASAFDGHISAIHAVLAIPMALSAWLAYRIVADQVGGRAGLAAALLLIVAPGDWHRFYIAVLNLAMLLFAARYLQTGALVWITALGAIAGGALCVRIDAAFAGFALLALCIALTPRLAPGASRARAARRAAAGLCLAVLPCWLFFAAEGILADYLHQIVAFPSAMLDRTSSPYQLAPPRLREIWWGSTFAAMYYASLLVPVAAVAMLFNRRACTGRCRLFWIATTVWLLFNLSQFLIERPDLTHLSHRTYALVVPAVVFFSQVVQRGALAHGLYSRAVALLAGTLLLLGGAMYIKLVQTSPGSLGAALQPRQEICLANGVCYTDGIPEATPHLLLNEVLGLLAPSETVGALPYGPGIAYLVGHPLPGRQVFLLPHSVRSPGAEHEYIQALAGVRYVMLDRMFRYSRSTTSTLASYAPAVNRLLATCFTQRAAQGAWTLLERTNRDAPCRTGDVESGASRDG